MPEGRHPALRGPAISWRVEASLRTLERPIDPGAVEGNGRPLADGAWSRDAGQGVLRARFEVRGTLVVRGCAG